MNEIGPQSSDDDSITQYMRQMMDASTPERMVTRFIWMEVGHEEYVRLAAAHGRLEPPPRQILDVLRAECITVLGDARFTELYSLLKPETLRQREWLHANPTKSFTDYTKEKANGHICDRTGV